MADNTITGRAKKHDGTAIDYVSIFNWADGKCIAQVSPDASGVWTHTYDRSLRVGITYVADGCEPITHGAYDFNYLSGIPSDTILHYDLNGDVLDRSNNLNHGTITNGAANYVTGRKANTQAINFNSGNPLIQSSSTVPFGTTFVTVSFWVYKPTSGSQVGHFINNKDGSNSYFAIVEGNWSAGWGAETRGINGSGQNIFQVTAATTKDTWHHVLIEFDRTKNSTDEISIYIDNVKASGTKPGSFDHNAVFGSGKVTIGGLTGTGHTFRSIAQDIRIYNRVLTANERTALFNE